MAIVKKEKRVKPQLLKGFRDYSPEEQFAREEMLASLRQAVELMGFLPLQTASLEFAETLLGSHYSPDNLSELFGFVGPDEVEMALRYEFTLSLARYVASEPQLPLPFRRYQYGTVWRVDKPGPGRYREFMQFDIDIVGTTNLLADAEIVAAMVRMFEHLCLSDTFQMKMQEIDVRYSSRRLLNAFLEWAGIESERGQEVLRVLDKFNKLGQLKVIDELGPGYTDDSGAKITGLHLSDKQIDKVKEFLFQASEHGIATSNPLAWSQEHLSQFESGKQGIAELQSIRQYLADMGVSQKVADIDLLIVRGLAYYTGPVFETYLTKAKDFGSVFSGGRYDDLVSRFSGESRPGVGASVGVDRLLAALLHLNAIKKCKATSQVLVTVMDSERLPDYLRMLAELRSAGIRSEIFSGNTRNLTKQVRYADRVGIPLALIAGSDEFKAKQVTVKNLAVGAAKSGDAADRETWLKADGFQEQVERIKLVEYVKKQLERIDNKKVT